MTTLENRIKAEKAIVKSLAKECFMLANSQGTVVYVDYGNFSDSVACYNPSQVWSAVNATDECHVIVKNTYTGRTLAVFFIVLGNDGYDCIADYGVNDFSEKVIKEVDKVSDKWENKLVG